jgi:hypothetical protein
MGEIENKKAKGAKKNKKTLVSSVYYLGINREVFVLAPPEIRPQIEKSLTTLQCATLVSPKELIHNRNGEHYIVCPCSFTDAKSIDLLRKIFRRYLSKNVRKVVYSLSPGYLGIDQILFCQEIGASFVGHGMEPLQSVREYIKRSITRRDSSHLIASTKARMNEINHENERAFVKLASDLVKAKTHEPPVLQLIAQLNLKANKPKKTLFYLKKILETNPQDLWSTNLYAKTCLKISSAQECLENLNTYSDFTYMNANTDLLPSLTRIPNLDYQKETIDFLNLRASLAGSVGQKNEAIYFLELLLLGTRDPKSRSHVCYKLSVLYKEVLDLEKAQHYKVLSAHSSIS